MALSMLPNSFFENKLSSRSKNNIDLKQKQKTQSLNNIRQKPKKKSKESRVSRKLLRRPRPQSSRRINIFLRLEQPLNEILIFHGSILLLKVRILLMFKKNGGIFFPKKVQRNWPPPKWEAGVLQRPCGCFHGRGA